MDCSDLESKLLKDNEMEMTSPHPRGILSPTVSDSDAESYVLELYAPSSPLEFDSPKYQDKYSLLQDLSDISSSSSPTTTTGWNSPVIESEENNPCIHKEEMISTGYSQDQEVIDQISPEKNQPNSNGNGNDESESSETSSCVTSSQDSPESIGLVPRRRPLESDSSDEDSDLRLIDDYLEEKLILNTSYSFSSKTIDSPIARREIKTKIARLNFSKQMCLKQLPLSGPGYESRGTNSQKNEAETTYSSDSTSSLNVMDVQSDRVWKQNHLDRVVEEVKFALRPFYDAKKVTKEEYKDILRRAVRKVRDNPSGQIKPAKIAAMVHAYVKRARAQRRNKKDVMKNGQKVEIQNYKPDY